MQVSHHLPAGATTGKSLTSPFALTAVFIVYQQTVNHGDVKSASKIKRWTVQSREQKKKKRWIACRLMGRQTCQHGGAYKSPTMTRQMKKSRCAGWRGVLVYKHPVSWVTVVQLKVIRSTPVHSSSAAAYGAALGLARWISHMDSSPVSMMKRLILL